MSLRNISSPTLIGLLALSACVAPVHVGSTLPPAEIAVIKGKSESAELRAAFASYAEGSSLAGETKVGGALSGYPAELRVKPGTYTLLVRCEGGSTGGFPTIVVRVTAGNTYEIGCSRTGMDGRMVRAGVTSIKPTGADK